MIIDLSCPIELRSYELLNDDNGTTRAYIYLYNLSNRVVTAYAATTNWYNGITRARATETIAVDKMRIPPRSAFKLLHSTQSIFDADHIELYFSSVTFDDGEIWTPRDGDLVDIGEQSVLRGEELDLLKAKAGEDCVQYPQVQSKYWRCVCGRINLLDSEACARCGRSRNWVLVELNAKAVRKNRAPKRRRAQVARSQNAKRDPDFALKCVLIALLIILCALIGYEIGKDDKSRAPANTPAPTEWQDDNAEVYV